MKKALFSLLTLSALIMASCSKDDDDGTQEKMIIGKWTPVSTKVKVSDLQNGGSTTTNVAVYAGDYLDFRSDGKVYSYISDPTEGPGYNPRDTMPYKFTTTYLVIGEDSMFIGALTKDSLAFILQEKSNTELWETTFSFKK